MMKKFTNIFKCILLLTFCLAAMPISVKAGVDGYFNAKPRVIIQSFSVSDDAIVPGKEFDLTLVISNPGRVYSANNILLTFTNDVESVAVVSPNSDQLYIETIGPGETKVVTLKLKASELITTETVRFDINAVYADDETSSNINDMSIQLPVTQSSEFEIESISFPAEIYTNSKTRAHVTYKNSGSDNFYNVTMYISGDEIDETQQYSLGSLIAGKTSYTEAYLLFSEAGTKSLNIYFTYEDIEGNVYTTFESTTQIDVAEGAVEEEQEPLTGSETLDVAGGVIGRVVILGGILVMGIVVIQLIRKYSR